MLFHTPFPFDKQASDHDLGIAAKALALQNVSWSHQLHASASNAAWVEIRRQSSPPGSRSCR